MLLRIVNLKALGQRFQVRNPRWRPQRSRAWSEIRYLRMIKKQQNDKRRRKLCENRRKRIYLVYNVFKAWRMQKSRRDVTVGIAVISPHICCLLNTEECKNNAIYVL